MWQMQFTGKKAAVQEAIKAYEPVARPQIVDQVEGDVTPEEPVATAEELYLKKMKKLACDLIDAIPPSQNGVEVVIAGIREEVTIFSVRGLPLVL